jgi:crotonobetainyl-CoA:carnitine CoA-transferase CaiB-like acyl-CoA transferase
MSVSGAPGEPMRAGPPIADLVAGLYAAFGIIAALLARGRSAPAQGQRVEASLTGGLISMLAYFSAQYFATGDVPVRTGNDHPVVYPYGLFHAADGEVAIAPSTPVHVRRFLETVELGHLLEDAAFADNAARVRNRERLRPLIDAALATATVEQWIGRLNAAGVPCGRVMNLAEVFSDPQVQAQEMMLEVEHPSHGPVRMTGFPVKLSATPAQLRRPAPALGEHTDAVLRELGYPPDRIAALRTAKVV